MLVPLIMEVFEVLSRQSTLVSILHYKRYGVCLLLEKGQYPLDSVSGSSLAGKRANWLGTIPTRTAGPDQASCTTQGCHFLQQLTRQLSVKFAKRPCLHG